MYVFSTSNISLMQIINIRIKYILVEGKVFFHIKGTIKLYLKVNIISYT